MKVILISLFFISYTSYCQDKGIRFEHGLLWNQILEKAKSENKFIFIDAYTTWCGPCRYMSNSVFTQEKVGDFFNKNFINVKLQIDSTENDSDEVKQWYATAHQFSQQYNIIGYPTFLFFDANGEAVHKILAGAEADEFLEKTAKALNPKTQYYTLLNKYNNGEKSSSFLFDLSNAALDAYEMTLGTKVAKEYFRTKAALTSKEDLKLLFNCTFSKADTGFKLILKNPQQFNSALGEKRAAENKLIDLILFEEVMPELNKINQPNFTNVQSKLSIKYPKLAKEISALAKLYYYEQEQNKKQYFIALISYVKSFSDNLNHDQLNQYAWEVFESSNNPIQLQEAIKWIKLALSKKEDAMYLDTYACLLYKLGRAKEAIEWETKAASIATEEDKATIEATLKKMKEGKKIRINQWAP